MIRLPPEQDFNSPITDLKLSLGTRIVHNVFLSFASVKKWIWLSIIYLILCFIGYSDFLLKPYLAASQTIGLLLTIKYRFLNATKKFSNYYYDLWPTSDFDNGDPDSEYKKIAYKSAHEESIGIALVVLSTIISAFV